MKKKNIIRMLRIVFIIASISSLAFVPWILVKAWVLPLPDTVQEQVNQTIGHGFDGMIVYVDEAGKSPSFYSAGLKSRNNKEPADAQSLFKIASISKLYVAVAVAKLANEQRLSLDKTLADYIPAMMGRIEHADKITLKLMVQHRSGIPNFTDTPGYWEQPPENSKQRLDLVLDKPANFEPNEEYSYSNTNYLLIGEIIDKTLGYSHREYIKKEILTPLGLNNTYSLISEVDIEEVASGYYVGYEDDMKFSFNSVGVSGSMVATAQDVGIFLRALNDGSLLNEKEQAIYSSIYVYKHGGLLPGYQSLAEYHKDIDTVVIQFLNTTDFDGYQWNLSQISYSRLVQIIRKIKNKHRSSTEEGL
jgi:CubicO group peptidase (beta-lactamase class C family)